MNYKFKREALYKMTLLELFEKYEVEDQQECAAYLLDLVYKGTDPFHNLDYYIQQYQKSKKFKKEFRKFIEK